MSRTRSVVDAIVLAPFDTLNQRAAALRAEGHDVISMGQAIPGMPPPPAAIAAAQRALADGRGDVYSPDAGLLSLREAIAGGFRESWGADVTSGDVMVTAGANQAFMLAAMTLIDAGDDVVLASPFFANHEMALRALGARVVEAPLNPADGFRPAWVRLEPHLSPTTKAVVLCSPSNPTGAVVGRMELDTIAQQLARRGILLFVDETYMHFVYDAGGHQTAAAAPRWRDNVVVVSTFSKSLAITGWRVGFMLADPSIGAQALKIQDSMIICAPVACQVGVEEAIRATWDYPAPFRGELVTRRAAMIEALAGSRRLRWVPTGGGFFAFVHVDGCHDSMAMSADILEHAHVVTIPGSVSGKAGEGHLRLSFGAVDVPRLREGVRRLRRFLSDPAEVSSPGM